MKILAIVPARSGSKSIKDKNIVDINGKPLMAYSIETALKLKKLGLIDKIIVSTDSEEYAKIGKKYGAEVPFLRPAEISGDKAKSIEFILHAVDYFDKQKIKYYAVLLLQPTSPIRRIEVMKQAIEDFEKSSCDSALSCYEENYVCDLVMYSRETPESIILNPLNSNHNKGVLRQEHASHYVRNGCIYLTKVDYLRKEQKIICDHPMLIEMRKSDSVNIDTPDDLDLLRKLL